MSKTKVVKRRDGTVLIHTDIETAREIARRCREDVNPDIALIATEVNKKIGGVPALEPKEVEDTEDVPEDEDEDSADEAA